MLQTVVGYAGFLGWVWSTVIGLGLFVLLAYRLRGWKIRERGRRILRIESRLEAAFQNVKAASAVAAARTPGGGGGVFVGGLRTSVRSPVLRRRPQTPGAVESRQTGAAAEERIQQT